MDDGLQLFHPLVAHWFTERVGKPTRIQTLAWREIASGGHLLATAPTGSGKTLAAFLWAIDRMITGAWPGGMTRILYISPLKALNNDIRRNLLSPLGELERYFTRAGHPFPPIRVMTRSGDTPADERRALQRHPPEILITTPESLNIMLTGKNGGAFFQGVRTVILDEIHAVAASKRGTHLMTAVERLTLFSGEFQRIALSATVRPLETVADFVGGFERLDGHGEAVCRKRPVAILRSDDDKRYVITVESPEKPGDGDDEETLWRNLSLELKDIALKNRSTLIFTKSRRVAEKIARYINEGEEFIVAYSHHGSIAREIRLEVEERMKRGELRAIVATSSLELGIDIGELDEVILVQTPFSISSSLQRLGRAGHGVGETSRGRLYPAHGMDYLTAAVMARCLEKKVTEPIHPPECPLDVLAQVIVSMTASERWEIDDLYAFFKCCYPYRNLTANQYRLVLEMLAGRYAESRIKDLAPRISIDRIDNTVEAKSGASYLLYTSGGTIPDRGYYDLRVKESRAKIGELDEEFVWERRIGDTFTLGTQIWRIQNITHNAVEVSPLRAKTGMVPFWRAEEQDRDFFYAERILDFLREADDRLSDPENFRRQLETGHAMSPESTRALTEFLQRQKEACAKKLPHRTRIVIEHYHGGTGRAVGRQTVLHTMWGGRLNRPLAMALSAAWEKKQGVPLEVYTGDATILLVLPNDAKVTEVIRMVTPENVEELLRERLESSGFFGAKFRENAARALLLPRAGFRRRYPLWLNRLRARRLHEAVMRFPDFPIVLETWRECLQDAFDLPNLKMMLDELQTGRIEVTEVENETPSPFCGSLIWRQTNKYMYEDDTPESLAPSGLSRKLLDEVLYSSQLRPRIAPHLARELEGRLQRLKAGYAPSTPVELLDWLKERLLIPADEWHGLIDACRRDAQDFPANMPEMVAKKITSVTLRGSAVSHLCALENMPLLKRLFPVAGKDGHPGRLQNEAAGEGEMDRADFIAQWLSYYGPVDRSWIEDVLGIRGDDLDFLLEGLVEEGRVIVDTILEGSENVEVCHADNLDRLLRMARLARQPSFQALPIEYLPLFIASYQGLARPGETLEDLQTRLEKLFGYPAPARLWEEAILPARMADYQPAWLDALMNSSPLLWYGAGKEAAAFALETELDIFVSPHEKDREKSETLFPDARGKYDLFHIASHAALTTEEATRRLWELTWKSAVTNDSMETLRKGILNGFQAAALDTTGHGGRNHGRHSAMRRWASSRPIPGNWRMLDVSTTEPEGIERQELARERARMLFDRYGILFRELLENEAEPLRWRNLFPVLRLMELSGEIMSGYFFEGIPGVQFISFEAFRFLRDGLDEERIYWMNTKDPASLCGIGLEGLKGTLPRRVPSNHIVFMGRRVVMESMKNGRELRINIPPDHPRLHECLEMFKTLLSRGFNPVKGIVVEKINGVTATKSEYRDALREYGFISGYGGLELRRKY